jgi:hypothetical protein
MQFGAGIQLPQTSFERCGAPANRTPSAKTKAPFRIPERTPCRSAGRRHPQTKAQPPAQTKSLRRKKEERVSEKSTRKAPDYAFESTAARNRPVFRPRMQRGSCKTLRSGTIQASRCRKGRLQLQRPGVSAEVPGTAQRSRSEIASCRTLPPSNSGSDSSGSHVPPGNRWLICVSAA